MKSDSIHFLPLTPTGLVFRDVDQDAVRISQLELAEAAGGKKFLSNFTLGIFLRAIFLGKQMGALFQVSFERGHTFHFESDMIERWAFDS